jgi:hypothetical protein
MPPPGKRSLLMDTTHELVAALSTNLDAAGTEIQEVKEKLRKTLRGDPGGPAEWKSGGASGVRQ